MGKHNDSNSHKKASEDLIKALDYGKNDVTELLDDQIITTPSKNWNIWRKMFGNIHFFGRQPLPYCGNWSNDSESEEKRQFSTPFAVKKFRWSSPRKVAQFRIEDKIHLIWNSKRNLSNYELASFPWNSAKYTKLSYIYNSGRWISRYIQ